MTYAFLSSSRVMTYAFLSTSRVMTHAFLSTSRVMTHAFLSTSRVMTCAFLSSSSPKHRGGRNVPGSPTCRPMLPRAADQTILGERVQPPPRHRSRARLLHPVEDEPHHARQGGRAKHCAGRHEPLCCLGARRGRGQHATS